MKTTFKQLSVVALLAVTTIAFKPQAVVGPELEIGASIPKTAIKMMDVSGKEVSLGDAKREKGLLVIFSCNTCPYVKLSESRIKEVTERALKNNIGVIIINSNEAQRGDEDSFEEMKKYAITQNYSCSYVVDKNSELADAFGATRTPHCFLFDKKGLVYRGAIDDNVKDPAAAKEHYLKDAIDAVAKGTVVKTNSTKSVGCGIKRLS
ncbi:MAG TPA: thioredoxin family protein [Bacteroidia bacterium]|jgi:thioredoxin-related protein|nr:thioredoxin family protein [Bacteroidia bacterium]